MAVGESWREMELASFWYLSLRISRQPGLLFGFGSMTGIPWRLKF